MTINGTTFIGYDRDGDSVFRLPNGNLIAISGGTEEEADAEYTIGGVFGTNGFLFEERYGPITKEAP